jgi:hypothetical protein
MTEAEIAEARESTVMSWLIMTFPSSPLGVKFRKLPDVKEDNRLLLGVKISKKEMPDIELWVDSETFLPARYRYTFKRADGKVVTMETSITETKKQNDIVITAKSTTYRNGEKWIETSVENFEFFEDGKKLDFSRP